VATQRWDPDEYARTAAFVPELGLPVLDLLAPQPGECILDLGCGDGVLTARLAEVGATVVGVDASEAMVAAARARGLDARVVDGRRLSFVEEFDAVFSNAALHWMGDLAGICRGTFRALRPGGRFVGELGAAGNVAAVVDAIGTGLLNPWVFPTAGEFGALLKGAGLQVSRLETIERPTPLPGDIVEWLGTFAGCFLDALESRERRNFEQELRDILAPRLRSPDGIWCVDYVRLRFAATKPE
jgi:trans-aconitate methyltransferase